MIRPISRSRLGIVLGLLISAAALFLAIRWSGWPALVEALSRVDLRLVLLAILLFVLSMLARVLAWRALLGWSFTFRRVFNVLNEGYLLNNLLPWRLGEVGRAVLLGQGQDHSVLSVLSSIFIERMYDLLLAASLLLILFPFALRLPGALSVAIVLGLGLVLGLVLVRVALNRPKWIAGLAARLPGGRGSLASHFHSAPHGRTRPRGLEGISIKRGVDYSELGVGRDPVLACRPGYRSQRGTALGFFHAPSFPARRGHSFLTGLDRRVRSRRRPRPLGIRRGPSRCPGGGPHLACHQLCHLHDLRGVRTRTGGGELEGPLPIRARLGFGQHPQAAPVKILNSLYYYRPHYSGLTVYTERLAKELARRGHTISVLTSRYDASLPRDEQLEGVHVHRVGVALRVSKGPIMPALLPTAHSLLMEHDLLHLHVPQLDAAPLAYLARRMGKPVVVTYHCDLSLPPTFLNSIANLLSRAANRITVAAADRVVVNTLGYAKQSRLLSGRMDKVIAIPPPIEIPAVEQERVAALLARSGAAQAGPIIGMAARLASEKGAEILARALPEILRHHPNARVLYVGQNEDVLGEQSYGRRIRDLLKPLSEHWTFLGILDPRDLAAFFNLCDVTVLPSLNSTESFGMVQVESMFCGTPVAASDLPGVREVTATTGMGVVFPAGDHAALAANVLQIIRSPETYMRDPQAIRARFGTPVIASQYEELFTSLLEAPHEGSYV